MTTEKQYEYTVNFLQNGKIKDMKLVAESRDHARMIFENYVENMQAFTESGPEIFTILSIR